MKVIFLDIDGVMNSQKYDLEKGNDGGIMDPTRLDLLKELIDETQAEVVLTSSWRHNWSFHEAACFGSGKRIFRELFAHGIRAYDKTPSLFSDRTQEIKAWLEDNPDAESFVILDDIPFGWEDLEPYVVKTNYRIGRGLEAEHIEKAIQILNS